MEILQKTEFPGIFRPSHFRILGPHFQCFGGNEVHMLGSADFYVCVYIYIYIFFCMCAYNVIWWAVLGFQDVMKQQKIRRIMEKKPKTHRKYENTMKIRHDLVAFFRSHFRYTLLFLRCRPFLGPPNQVTATHTHLFALRPICCPHFGPVSKENSIFALFGGN